MTTGADEPAGLPDAGAAERRRLEAERRRRRARVFGDVLPEATRDDSEDADGPRDRGHGAGSDEWWRRQVPPHHG